MTESEIIWDYILDSYPDTHQAIANYAKTDTPYLRDHSSITTIFRVIKDVFSPKDEFATKTVIKAFLDMKRKQYQKGEIKISSIY